MQFSPALSVGYMLHLHCTVNNLHHRLIALYTSNKINLGGFIHSEGAKGWNDMGPFNIIVVQFRGSSKLAD